MAAESLPSLFWQWLPALGQGFALNIAMGLLAMALATAAGTLLGLAQIIAAPGLARLAGRVGRGLRNLPWLVVMFYVAYLLPYEVKLAGHWLQLADWLKVALGLALPASGYVAEMLRGALQAVPAGQWQAAQALGLSRWQALRWVIAPQSLRSLLPPWMNLFCTLCMSTSLGSLLGVEELMSVLQSHLAGQLRPDVLLPAYALAFAAFFFFIYPLARWARHLELRWSH
ncbi:ABC transporter permease subunit [Pantoea sp. Tr-811]|uniref:ABC transporter permease subunit n=1 Tax=Pantoea sp. Tr-811 TaxID=2608361 RepID=UPI001422A0D8|nr:ABC transporter permease subunit [Pantoea sp. Tr-811]NIF27625.1 ABC transporter permease subunit [Pantoea sp. Tr-811]